MTKAFKERILDMIEHATDVDLLDTDYTSVLIRVTFKDGHTQMGVFYPKEWSLADNPHDDLELETERSE